MTQLRVWHPLDIYLPFSLKEGRAVEQAVLAPWSQTRIRTGTAACNPAATVLTFPSLSALICEWESLYLACMFAMKFKRENTYKVCNVGTS